MTERLYYEHPVITELSARVVSCEKTDRSFAVVFDRTIIFPEGGGQPADRGTAGKANILDAFEKDGDVYHVADSPLEPGAECVIKLDLERRLDHTCQHTGEHILSGLAYKLFGARNVGFHMAEDYCTIDLDKFLDEDALALLEREANAAVRRDLPVTEAHMDHEALSKIEIRKKSDVKSDDIRVVYIGGGDVDSCTCCGTHCFSSGEVGYIRIGDSQKYKGGVRLWFSCGGRAVNEANALTRAMTGLARSYSTSRDELPSAVRKQSDELASLKRELKARTLALSKRIAAENKEPIAVVMEEGFGANDVKMLSEELVAHGARIALVFGRANGSVNYRALRGEGETVSMGEVVKAVNALTCGKGGGSPVFAQGASSGDVTEEMLLSLRKLLKDWTGESRKEKNDELLRL